MTVRLQHRQLQCYLVIQSDALLPGTTFEQTLSLALKGGVTIVQLREKKCSTRAFLDLATSAKQICDRFAVPLLINDRLDVALAMGADGLHIGQDDMPVATARRLLGDKAIIGVSATSAQEAMLAVEHGADYLGIGPCYPTKSKEDIKATIGPRGAARILTVISGSDIPTVIIGGVNVGNAARVLHGATSPSGKALSGIAVVSAISSAGHPDQAAKELLAIVQHMQSTPWPSSSLLHSSQETLLAGIKAIFLATRADGGVIQSITNTVVQNDSANATLALSCSPIMSSEAAEAEDLGNILGALCINLGTISDAQVAGMLAAGQAANRNRKPVVFDPVGCGASKLRKGLTDRLLNAIQFTVIKGNAGEIASIAGAAGATSRGVDSSGSLNDAGIIVKQLAKQERCIVVLTGEIDYISDGHTIIELRNGHSLLGKITGSGCLTGAAIGCFAASAHTVDASPFGLCSGNQLQATVTGVLSVCIAGEKAAARADVYGPGSFRSAFLDELATLDAESLLRSAKIVCRH